MSSNMSVPPSGHGGKPAEVHQQPASKPSAAKTSAVGEQFQGRKLDFQRISEYGIHGERNQMAHIVTKEQVGPDLTTAVSGALKNVGTTYKAAAAGAA